MHHAIGRAPWRDRIPVRRVTLGRAGGMGETASMIPSDENPAVSQLRKVPALRAVLEAADANDVPALCEAAQALSPSEETTTVLAQALWRAVDHNNVKAIQCLADLGVSPNREHLKSAAASDHVALFQPLLDAGASLDDPDGEILSTAATRGAWRSIPALADLGYDLATHGAKALRWAVRMEKDAVARALIELGGAAMVEETQLRFRQPPTRQWGAAHLLQADPDGKWEDAVGLRSLEALAAPILARQAVADAASIPTEAAPDQDGASSASDALGL